MNNRTEPLTLSALSASLKMRLKIHLELLVKQLEASQELLKGVQRVINQRT